MDIFINTDKSPALVQAKATGSPLSAFKVKRGAIVPLSVRREMVPVALLVCGWNVLAPAKWCWVERLPRCFCFSLLAPTSASKKNRANAPRDARVCKEAQICGKGRGSPLPSPGQTRQRGKVNYEVRITKYELGFTRPEAQERRKRDKQISKEDLVPMDAPA